MDTIPGRDGQVRGAVVKVCPKGKRCKLMCRSVKQLYPLAIGNGQLNEEKGTTDREGQNVIIQEVEVDEDEIEIDNSPNSLFPTDRKDPCHNGVIDNASGPNSPIEHPEKQCDQLTGEREASREMTSECLPSSLRNGNNEPSHDHANTNPIDRVQTNIIVENREEQQHWEETRSLLKH